MAVEADLNISKAFFTSLMMLFCANQFGSSTQLCFKTVSWMYLYWASHKTFQVHVHLSVYSMGLTHFTLLVNWIFLVNSIFNEPQSRPYPYTLGYVTDTYKLESLVLQYLCFSNGKVKLKCISTVWNGNNTCTQKWFEYSALDSVHCWSSFVMSIWSY